ncbi:MAG TPA: LPS assembly lipoprotein LptE [Candidatus Limnocylindrales bacterium]|nr:LPS assembly lipoprotein LptE [Candidatus Limnocylindrales bacterium]
MKLRSAVLAVALVCSGCGYTFVRGGNLPADVSSIRVARVEVGDGDPLLADALTRELRRVLRWRGRFRPVDESAPADAVLAVRVTTDRTRAVAFNEFDDVLDYQSTLSVDAELSRPGGEKLWSGSRIAATRGHAAVPGAVVTSSAAFQGQETLDEEALERFNNVQLGEERRAEARERAVRDLAEAIYSRMTEGL